jgi:hypothetical protein
MTRTRGWIVGAALLGTVMAACSNASSASSPQPGGIVTSPPATGHSQTAPSSPSLPSQTPIPIESNPPGDIPDTIAYVPHSIAKTGVSVKIPEGWSETTSNNAVNFTDKLNAVNVSWTPASSAPTVTSAKKTEVPALQSSTLAFQLKSVTTAHLPAGPAVLITYEGNSTPNAVTGKQYREIVLRYELYKSGQETVLSLISPVGADNVDPWRIVTESFQWR